MNHEIRRQLGELARFVAATGADIVEFGYPAVPPPGRIAFRYRGGVVEVVTVTGEEYRLPLDLVAPIETLQASAPEPEIAREIQVEYALLGPDQETVGTRRWNTLEHLLEELGSIREDVRPIAFRDGDLTELTDQEAMDWAMLITDGKRKNGS